MRLVKAMLIVAGLAQTSLAIQIDSELLKVDKSDDSIKSHLVGDPSNQLVKHPKDQSHNG